MKLITPVIQGSFYWLGWFDPDGKPANSKIIYTVAAFASIGLCVRMGLRLVEKSVEVNWPYVGLVTVVLSFAAGVEVFKKVVNYLASRAPGTTTPPSRPSQATEVAP